MQAVAIQTSLALHIADKEDEMKEKLEKIIAEVYADFNDPETSNKESIQLIQAFAMLQCAKELGRIADSLEFYNTQDDQLLPDIEKIAKSVDIIARIYRSRPPGG